MRYTNMYSNKIVYQKYLVTSIKVGCATRSLYASSGPKAEGVPANNQYKCTDICKQSEIDFYTCINAALFDEKQIIVLHV